MSATGIGLTIWFAATAASVAYIAYDLLTRTPEMKVMKWGWVLVALYTGPSPLWCIGFPAESRPLAHMRRSSLPCGSKRWAQQFIVWPVMLRALF